MRLDLKSLAAVAISVMLAGCSMAIADDQVPLDKAPAAVQATVNKVVGSNKFVSLDSDVENGKTVYEVDAEGKNASYSVHISATGEVLGISLDIPIEIVPDAVIAAAVKAHPEAKPTEPEIRTADGKTYYKVEFMVGKAQHEMLINADGKVISDETDNETGGTDDVKKP